MLSVLKYRGLSGFLEAIYYKARIKIAENQANHEFIEKNIYDYKLLLDPLDPGISRTLLLFSQRELDHKFMLEKVLQPGMTVLDIGANIGYYAIMESKLVGDHGKIIAVEPSPTNVALLKKNIQLNECSNVSAYQGAVSNTSGTKDFYLAKSCNLNTFHVSQENKNNLTGQSIKVKIYSIKDIVSMTQIPDIMRMDVEGHEVEIFSGMLPEIEAGNLQPMIIFETHNSLYNEEHNMSKPLQRLFQCGYKTKLLASNSQTGADKIKSFGYKSIHRVQTDFVVREIFENISNEDALNFICKSGARTVLLSKDKH